MTARLVGLMSLVLLLSFAALAVMLGRYEDSLRAELKRAVRETGRATILQFHAFPPPGEEPERVRRGAGAQPGTGTTIREQRTVRVLEGSVTRESSPEGAVVLRVQTAASGAAPGPLRVPQPAPGVRTEDVLRQEIKLPVPIREFDLLLSDFRRRSLLVLLLVFALGAALSAALAHRFTRPVRELDRAFRRLGEGDFGVTVEIRGRDEMARLAGAFNDVARRLGVAREGERDLQRRERLSALGRLAAGVAHDVRNPLHSIGLTLQHLEETCAPEEPGRAGELRRLVGIVRAEIQRLDRLVESFLRFARSERRSPEATDLGALVRDVEKLVEREAARRQVQLEVAVEEGVHPVPADAAALRSAVLNLVLNSFEAMPGGGRLVLAVRRSRDGVEISVRDTGRGIPEAEQEKVFDFAWTTREGGSGLGLAMVHQTVVEDHGGKVKLESRPGEGTEVRLLLPLPAGAA